MTERGFIAQLQGYGLTTAEIHYYRPDAPSLLLDGVHPSDAGHTLVADLLTPAILDTMR